jgi:hypothetical protein
VTTTRERIQFEPLKTDFRLFGARLEGVTPLLMHNPRWLMRVEEQVASRKRIPTPKEEADASVYRLDDDDPTSPLAVPADNVRQALLDGSKGLRFNRKPMRPILAATVFIVEPRFMLTRNGQPLLTYDRIDTRRVNVQRQGVMRSRALIDVPWELEVRFKLDVSIVHVGLLMQALQEAGTRMGLLEYRPEQGGSFGRFQVVDGWLES